MNTFLWSSVDHDVRIDLGISPNAETPFYPCPKCGIDVTDFTEEEASAHSRFHEHMAAAPKSIPSQSHVPDSKTIGWELYEQKLNSQMRTY